MPALLPGSALSSQLPLLSGGQVSVLESHPLFLPRPAVQCSAPTHYSVSFPALMLSVFPIASSGLSWPASALLHWCLPSLGETEKVKEAIFPS